MYMKIKRRLLIVCIIIMLGFYQIEKGIKIYRFMLNFIFTKLSKHSRKLQTHNRARL